MTKHERDPLADAATVMAITDAVTQALPAALRPGLSVSPLPLEGLAQVQWPAQSADSGDQQACTAAHARARTVSRRVADTLATRGYTLTQTACSVQRTPSHVTYGAWVKVAL